MSGDVPLRAAPGYQTGLYVPFDTRLLRVLTIATAEGDARARLTAPDAAPVGALMLGHGAGGGVDAPDIRTAAAGRAGRRLGGGAGRAALPRRRAALAGPSAAARCGLDRGCGRADRPGRAAAWRCAGDRRALVRAPGWRAGRRLGPVRSGCCAWRSRCSRRRAPARPRAPRAGNQSSTAPESRCWCCRAATTASACPGPRGRCAARWCASTAITGSSATMRRLPPRSPGGSAALSA